MPPKVAIVVEASNAYARSVLMGIGEFVLSHGPWLVHLIEVGSEERVPGWLRSWKGEGMLVRVENPGIAKALEGFRGALVDLTPSRLFKKAPWVKTDDGAVGRIAAAHFLERGFEHFGFCGVENYRWSKTREEHFAGALEGFPCARIDLPAARQDGESVMAGLEKWLVGLPKPVAVFACYDNRAQQVLEACRRRGLAVPEEVAVLGADNDEMLNALSLVPLSSVALNPRRVGWEAASLLDRMMSGEKVGRAEHLLEPVGVVTRQSSDILAVDDPQVARALRYIREHACEGLTVGELLQHCPMARRVLEIRFKKLLGRTPRQEIERVQLNRAKELLIRTELPVTAVAERVGFENAYLSVVFKQQFGLPPSQFRKRFAAH